MRRRRYPRSEALAPERVEHDQLRAACREGTAGHADLLERVAGAMGCQRVLVGVELVEPEQVLVLGVLMEDVLERAGLGLGVGQRGLQRSDELRALSFQRWDLGDDGHLGHVATSTLSSDFGRGCGAL